MRQCFCHNLYLVICVQDTNTKDCMNLWEKEMVWFWRVMIKTLLHTWHKNWLNVQTFNINLNVSRQVKRVKTGYQSVPNTKYPKSTSDQFNCGFADVNDYFKSRDQNMLQLSNKKIPNPPPPPKKKKKLKKKQYVLKHLTDLQSISCV